MTRRAQKDKEREHFDLFRKLLKQELQEYEEPDRGENPDFLLRRADHILGIEHTGLFKPTMPDQQYSPSQIESHCKYILRVAGSLCKERGVPPMKVEVCFNSSIEKFAADSVAQQLASFVEDRAKENTTDSTRFFRPGREIQGVSRVLLVAGVHNGKRWLCEHRWIMWGGVRVSVEFGETLQRSIDDKNEKYDRYRQKCDRCWLLVVADKRSQAQAFEMIDQDGYPRKEIYTSRFDRTFFMEVTEKDLVELGVTVSVQAVLFTQGKLQAQCKLT